MMCFLIVTSAFAQGVTMTTMTREEQLMQVAPSSSGQTGLFETVTADTLPQGAWSFGVYWNDYDLLAGEARDFSRRSAREYADLSYDLYRLSTSIGYGLTDRWEVSAMLPWDRIVSNGGDRAGFINGYLYNGSFTDSGLGNLRLATKFGLTPTDSPARFALSAFFDLPTGDDDGGITTGGGAFGVGGHWTRGIANLSGTYTIRSDRDETNIPGGFGDSFSIPNEFSVDGGLNVPLGFWRTTNWITEVNAKLYTGGDRAPDAPVFLVTGLRHWFGSSGWALNGGVRWNVAKFAENSDECRLTELDDCALSGLVGLTYAPLRFAAVAPPPPAPVYVPPPPAPMPVIPQPEPVTPPRMPSTLREDEIHLSRARPASPTSPKLSSTMWRSG